MVKSILVLGVGELGMGIIEALTGNPRYSKDSTPVSVTMRPHSVQSPSAEKQAQLEKIRNLGVSVVPLDIETESESMLVDTFSPYRVVIHAGTTGRGTQTKITKAVFAAGVGMYVPWQFGVDYDIIGADGGFGIFSEAHGVRQLLRSQSKTQWVIVSCGIFMTLLFEPFWGVVTILNDGRVKVTALNSWDDLITATTPTDIGVATAELVLNDKEPRNQAVHIAGDTMTYGDFAGVVEKETGKELVRDVWPLAELREKSKQDPGTLLKKYHVVFSEGKGLSWPKEQSWNAARGIEMQSIAGYLREHWQDIQTAAKDTPWANRRG